MASASCRLLGHNGERGLFQRRLADARQLLRSCPRQPCRAPLGPLANCDYQLGLHALTDADVSSRCC